SCQIVQRRARQLNPWPGYWKTIVFTPVPYLAHAVTIEELIAKAKEHVSKIQPTASDVFKCERLGGPMRAVSSCVFTRASPRSIRRSLLQLELRQLNARYLSPYSSAQT